MELIVLLREKLPLADAILGAGQTVSARDTASAPQKPSLLHRSAKKERIMLPSAPGTPVSQAFRLGLNYNTGPLPDSPSCK